MEDSRAAAAAAAAGLPDDGDSEQPQGKTDRKRASKSSLGQGKRSVVTSTSVYASKKAATGSNAAVHDAMTAVEKEKFRTDSYIQLRSRIEVAAYHESKINNADRLTYPLPLQNRGAQEELKYALEPLLGKVGTGSTPGHAVGQPLENPLPLTERIDGTLSALGIGGRTLVSFGGSDSRGVLVPAEPLVCDAVLRRWTMVNPASAGGGGITGGGGRTGGRAAVAMTPKVAAPTDDADDGPFGGGGFCDEGDGDEGDGFGGGDGISEYVRGEFVAESHAACSRHRHAATVMGYQSTLLAICGGSTETARTRVS